MLVELLTGGLDVCGILYLFSQILTLIGTPNSTLLGRIINLLAANSGKCKNQEK